ncbi:hypothetical protein [Streptomyces noursei]|uniref:hypothetical protein n=1 Tax=Streptomyces noursei TaxID=1971 RepID=UPI0037F14C0E
MFQQGTTVQRVTPDRDWGAYGTVTGDLGDGETYTVDLLPPRKGTAVWGHISVFRVWDPPDSGDVLPAIHPGGTIPIPGLRISTRPRRRPLPHPVVGSADEAETAAGWSPEYSPYDDPEGWTPVGEGAHRAVILNPPRTTVYKVETEAGRNQREHRTLSGLRDQGHTHAPPTTLWLASCGIVLAMPYLPNDGTRSRTPYPRAGLVDLNPENVTVCHGQYWLIDASGI